MFELAQHNNPIDYWTGPTFDLNMSFENLRDYQWKRLSEAIWSYLAGPFEHDFDPHQPSPQPQTIALPDPTATLTQFGTWPIASTQSIGVRILMTRSLFECVSLQIPLNMFAIFTAEVEAYLHQQAQAFAIECFKATKFSIASLGVGRECQLMMELISDPNARKAFMTEGNSLVQDDILIGLRVAPNQYTAIMPSLRWIPPK